MPAVIDSPRAFEDYLGGLDSPDKVNAAVTDGSFFAAVKGYVDTAKAEKTRELGELNAQIKEQTQAVLAELLKDDKAAKALDLNPLDKSALATKYGKIKNPRADGAPLDGLFTDVGEFSQ